MTGVRCDLVVPVYNALRSTRDCLASVRRFAPDWARVVVVNDGSDAATTEWLRRQEGILLLENPVNLGFVRTANRGLIFSMAPYVCLLNSDTLLTEGALERMVARMDADPSIALCCPLSNEAVNLSVRIPDGSDVFSFARRVARTSPALYPDAVTIVGFCLLVRREIVATLGVFDEVFGRGYCEETDYHYRCRAAGWRCVVADDAFVYHRHGASFDDRDARLARNMEILMARWRRLHEREIEEFNRKNALGAVRDGSYAWILPDDRPEPLDVLFLLPSVEGPAAAAVIPLVDALLLRGERAGVAVLDRGGTPEAEMFFRPSAVDAEHLARTLPACRALVATDAATAAAAALAAGGLGGLPIGLLEAGDARDVTELFAQRAAFFPGPGDRAVPFSPEPDLFYPRARGAFLVARPEAYARLAREKRAALFGSAHVVLAPCAWSAATALEAMAAGAVPVVARGSSAERVVREDVDALVLDAAHVGAWEDAAAALERDPARRERLAAAGLSAARGRTWDAAAGAFLAWRAELVPAPVALDDARRAALARLVAERARPRPAPVESPLPVPARGGLRARLGRWKRRLLA